MAEDTGSEPVPPDIRPFGRSSHQTLQHAKHGLGFAPLNPSSSPPGDASSASFDGDLQSHSYEQSHEHYAARKRAADGAARTIRILLLGLALVALLPAAAASPLNITAITDGADPYTSYAQAAVRPADTYEWNRQPIISSLKWVFLHAIDAVAALTGADVRGAGSRSTAYLGNAVFKREQLSTGQTVEAAITPVLVALSGMFAGLTLGYFSVDPTQLQVLSISGTPKQQEYARRIMPVRKDSHLLLTTLILGNMIVNEALPVVMDGYLGGGIQSVVISTALVVIFAEIIPQSVCSRYGLLIGASMAWPVRILIFIAFPIAWPIAKLLEYILGAHHGIIYRRSELRELIKMHAAGGEGGGDLDFDTVTMAQGALDLAGKTVKEAMTPIDSVFMLPIDAKLDYETLGHVVRSGHSRIPVYQMVEVPDINLSQPTLGPAKTKMVKKVLGSLLVKSCVLLDPEDATPLATIPINAIPSVPWDEPLTNMLNVFQEGRSHMAIVSRRPRRVENDPADAESVMTAAAGGLRQRFMRKVAEIAHGGSSGSDTESSDSDTDLGKAEKATKKQKKSRRKSEAGKSSKGSVQSMGSPTSTVAAGSTEADKVKNDARATTASAATDTEEAREVPATTEDKAAIPSNEKSGASEKKKTGSGIAQAVQLTQLEQSVPADAQLPSELVDKFFEGLEGAPLGIITLEDVLEELIGEEIYDEYDAHGPRNPASAFVPREAAMAAMQAAVAREKAKAEAAVTQHAADAEAEQTQQQQQQPAAKRTIIPKLPVKFSLGKKPLSQPGKSRTAPPVAAAPPGGPAEDTPSALPPIIASGKPTFAEPEPIGTTDAVSGGTAEGGLGSRSQSENRLAERRETSAPDLKSMRTGPGTESASAVPARLLPGGTGASSPGASASAAVAAPNLLSEAILIERGRRRMAATGSPAPGVMRAPSAPGVSRALAISPAARVPTPPTGGSLPPKSSGSPAGPPGLGSVPHTPGISAAGGAAAVGIIHSPQPVPAGKRGMFKSVPTPLPNTPIPGADYFDNKQDKDGRADLKGRKDEP